MQALRNIMAALIALGGSLVASGVSRARQQSFPVKPIRLISAFTPGGATDILARMFAASIVAQQGNRPEIQVNAMQQKAGARVACNVRPATCPDRARARSIAGNEAA